MPLRYGSWISHHLKTISGSLVVVFFMIVCNVAKTQTYSWNNQAGWDGVTHWSRFVINSPGFFGPNALPVPELKNGFIDSASSILTVAQAHYMPGDKTINPFVKIDYVILPGRAVVSVFVVPAEYYSVSHTLRDKRLLRNENPKGIAVGDINFGTTIQLLKNNITRGLTLSMFCRTTSGTSVPISVVPGLPPSVP